MLKHVLAASLSQSSFIFIKRILARGALCDLFLKLLLCDLLEIREAISQTPVSTRFMINNNPTENFWQLRCPPAVAVAETACIRTWVAPSQLTTMTCNLTPTELRTCTNGTVPRRGVPSFAGCARERNKRNDRRLFFVRCCGFAESQQRELHVGTLYFTHSVCYMLDVMIRFMGISLCDTT